MKLKDIAHFFTGPQIKKEEYSVEGVVVIQPADINGRGQIEPRNPAYIQDYDPKYLLQPGDMVMIRAGNRAGQVANYDAKKRCIPGPHVIVIRPKPGTEVVWNSLLIHRDAINGLKAGAAFPVIAVEDLAELDI